MKKFKFYFRKSSFKKDIKNGLYLLKLINEFKPKNFLEIGVLEGVTSRNVCEQLHKINSGDFHFVGIDLFGDDLIENNKTVEIKRNNLKNYIDKQSVFIYDDNLQIKGILIF